MEMKDYNLTCGEVIDNLLTLADAYEKASAGKAPNGFAFNPTDAAANMKAAVAFIGIFGQQIPRWIPVEERLPDDRQHVIACFPSPLEFMTHAVYEKDQGWFSIPNYGAAQASHWMPLPAPPADAK